MDVSVAEKLEHSAAVLHAGGRPMRKQRRFLPAHRIRSKYEPTPHDAARLCRECGISHEVGQGKPGLPGTVVRKPNTLLDFSLQRNSVSARLREMMDSAAERIRNGGLKDAPESELARSLRFGRGRLKVPFQSPSRGIHVQSVSAFRINQIDKNH
jgi:hypothetical protein